MHPRTKNALISKASKEDVEKVLLKVKLSELIFGAEIRGIKSTNLGFDLLTLVVLHLLPMTAGSEM